VVPGGTGTPVINGAIADLGVWWSWRCPDGTTAFKAALDAWRGPPLSSLAMQFMTHETVFEALVAMWRVFDTPLAACTAADPCDQGWLNLAKDAQEAAAGLPLPTTAPGEPPPPPAPSAVVAKNSTQPTRPAYRVVDGVILTREEGRATVGAPCDCGTTRLMRSTTMYCSAPPPVQSLVTVCRFP
jgi:hypothetical protein